MVCHRYTQVVYHKWCVPAAKLTLLPPPLPPLPFRSAFGLEQISLRRGISVDIITNRWTMVFLVHTLRIKPSFRPETQSDFVVSNSG